MFLGYKKIIVIEEIFIKLFFVFKITKIKKEMIKNRKAQSLITNHFVDYILWIVFIILALVGIYYASKTF